MATFKCIESLEENPPEVYLKVTDLILKLIDNVLRYPSDPKYRKLKLANKLVSTVIMPSIGAMECLFEIGFQEDDDALWLPPEKISMEKLSQFKTQIFTRRNKYLKDSASTPNVKANENQTPGNNCQTIETFKKQSLPGTSAADNNASRPTPANPFLAKLHSLSTLVLQYEEKAVKEKVLSVIPLGNINISVQRRLRQYQQQALKSGQQISEYSMEESIFIQELMNWFKNKFFKWVDSPKCLQCNSNSSLVEMSSDPSDRNSTEKVEVYKCDNCSARVVFHRHNIVTKLLETRRGRCGEWANVFTAVCRALGLEARLIYDQTDHAWTEIFFISEGRWVHCDPCEGALDKPLLYEKGWGKKLTYIMAYWCEGVQDVTWRYSAHHKDILARRHLCSESQLVETICSLNRLRQAKLTEQRRKMLAKRTLQELVEFMQTPEEHEGDTEGRQSGSLSWRLARQEITTEQANIRYVWKPTQQEVEEKKIVISYCTATDEYRRLDGEKITGWRSRVFLSHNVIRKEEKDWKMVYLCRSEGSAEGRVQWQIDVGESGLRVDTVQVQCPETIFHSGKMSLLLCSGDKCVTINQGKANFSILKGSTKLTLSVLLSAGKGNEAWQHAQILRQPLDTTEPIFFLCVTLT